MFFAIFFAVIMLIGWIQHNTMALICASAGMAICIILLTGTAPAR